MTTGARAGLVLAAAMATAAPLTAQTAAPARGLSVAVFVGAPLNLPTRLTIRQAGTEDLALAARWATRPFDSPIYYAVRVGCWDRSGAWEVELLHHKLFLTNPPAEVGQFDVSHGFNLVLLNRAVRVRGLVIRGGPGLVVAHPENRVRGQALPASPTLLGGGYRLAGPALQLAVGRDWRAVGPLAVGVEAKLTGAWARVPVAGGRANVPNVAVHALAGIGLAPR